MANEHDLEKGDYVIVRCKSKKILTIVDSLEDGITVHVEKGRELGMITPLNYIDDNLTTIFNLGPHPKVGKVYGCDVEVWLRSLDHPTWGPIHLFREMEPHDKKLLSRALNVTAKELKRVNLDQLLPVDFYIRTSVGKKQGWAKVKREQDEICISPFVIDENINRIIYFQVAFLVYAHLVPNELKAAWIEIYHSYVRVSKLNFNHMREMYKDFLESQLPITVYKKNLQTEEDKELMRAILAHIKTHHHLGPSHINTLIANNKDISDIWPGLDLVSSSIDKMITDESLKSPEHLFADAFSMYMCNDSDMLPKTIGKEIQNSVLVAGRL